MSWRTHSRYKGLSRAEKEWLREFDRDWDTKALGRSRGDAFDHMGGDDIPISAVCPKSFLVSPRLNDLPSHDSTGPALDAELSRLMGEVARFTVPKVTQYGWSIHLTMKDGDRMRARFTDYDSAAQAYVALQELSVTMFVS